MARPKITTLPSMFFNHQDKILHCAHHKAGSFWIACVLQDLCTLYGLRMAIFEGGDNRLSSYQTFDVLYDNNSTTVFDQDNFRGSHMIRDPRDVVVSGYFYHKWTAESWVHVFLEKFGMTYQQKLNQVSQDDGISMEMENMGAMTLQRMLQWNYHRTNMLEVRYEDLISSPDDVFRKLFEHWGVHPRNIDGCLEISRKHHMTTKTGRKVGEVDNKSHMRSGKPGQWKVFFTEQHKEYFKKTFGDALVVLGYEKNNDW